MQPSNVMEVGADAQIELVGSIECASVAQLRTVVRCLTQQNSDLCVHTLYRPTRWQATDD
jgi:hypothetical protein